MALLAQRPAPRYGGGVLCLLLVLLVGCGSPVRDQDGEPGVLRRQTVRVSTLDPSRSSDVYSSKIVGLIYETLVQYAYLARPYEVEPHLAAELPAVSADGLTYTFRIRPGICFQDDPCFAGGKGREVTSADFVYALKRLADLKNACPGWWAFNDRIVGLNGFRNTSRGSAPTDYDRNVPGLRAPDRYTLEIELTAPYPQLLWVLTMHYAAVVPREAVEHYGTEFEEHPVGTGPFVLHAWRRNHRLELRRNPKWEETGRVEYYPANVTAEFRARGLAADAGRPIPFIDRILFYVIDDSSTRWLSFVRGQLDLQAQVPRENWDAVITPTGGLTEALRAQGVQLCKVPSLDVAYIAFNMDDPVVGKNRKLRQALSCAINTDEWVRFYNHRIVRAKGPIPPGIAGHGNEPQPHAFNLVLARRLLREAGYPDGADPRTGRRLELTLDLGRTDTQSRESTELLISFMDKIGVVLVPSYNNWPTFLDKLGRRQAQMFRIGWVADYPDAENFLQLFYGPNASPGPNRCNYANPEFDALYAQTRVMQHSPGRTALYRQMAVMVIDDAPWIFLHHQVEYSLYHEWVRNFAPHDFPYGVEKYYKVAGDAESGGGGPESGGGGPESGEDGKDTGRGAWQAGGAT